MPPPTPPPMPDSAHASPARHSDVSNIDPSGVTLEPAEGVGQLRMECSTHPSYVELARGIAHSSTRHDTPHTHTVDDGHHGRFKLVCFDFDNTLAAVHLYKMLVHARACQTDAEFLQAYRHVFVSLGKEADVFGGAERLSALAAALEEMHRRGVQLYVITMGCVALVEYVLHRAGLARFVAGVTDENPKQQVVQMLMNTRFPKRLRADQAVLVDDSPSNFIDASPFAELAAFHGATASAVFAPALRAPEAECRSGFDIGAISATMQGYCQCMLVGKQGVQATELQTLVALCCHPADEVDGAPTSPIFASATPLAHGFASPAHHGQHHHQQAGQASPVLGTPTGRDGSVVIMRHGERLDTTATPAELEAAPHHVWPDRAARPYDTPLADATLPTLAAAALAERGVCVHRVITSPFRRCVQTATIVARYFSLPGITVDNRLGEHMPAVMQCVPAAQRQGCVFTYMQLEEAAAIVGGDMAVQWNRGAGMPALPDNIEARAQAVFADLAALHHPNTIVLVTHGDLFNALLPELEAVPGIGRYKAEVAGWALIAPGSASTSGGGRVAPSQIMAAHRVTDLTL